MSTDEPNPYRAPETRTERDGAPTDEPPSARELTARKRTSIGGGIFGVAYGLACRIAFADGNDSSHDWLTVMSIGFIFVVPFAIGFISVALGGRRKRFRASQAMVPAFATLGAALALAWEGLICVWLWLPIFAVLALIGGAVGHLVNRMRAPAAMAVAALPFMVAVFESKLPAPHETRTVANEIVVDAPLDKVWSAIASVPAITDDEHSFAFVHFIGFPRPIAATLDGVGVGAVRRATFERDVVFVETVTQWEEHHLLAFDISPPPEGLPRAGLDEHVTVGGPYFDVLQGTYELSAMDEGRTLLRLSSRHRLSTRFNAYARWWTDWIMSSTQAYILDVIARRCEATAPGLQG